MAKSTTATPSQISHQIYFTLCLIGIPLCLILAGLTWWGHSFIGSTVTEQLAAQKIYFPEQGAPGFDAETYPALQQYAGQLVDTPQEAEAYANDYIGHHLDQTADGKVYAEVSTLARQDPSNQQLANQKQTLFQGETLRGILLTSGYGFGTIGQILGIAAFALATTAVMLGLLAVYCRIRS